MLNAISVSVAVCDSIIMSFRANKWPEAQHKIYVLRHQILRRVSKAQASSPLLVIFEAYYHNHPQKYMKRGAVGVQLQIHSWSTLIRIALSQLEAVRGYLWHIHTSGCYMACSRLLTDLFLVCAKSLNLPVVMFLYEKWWLELCGWLLDSVFIIFRISMCYSYLCWFALALFLVLQ